MEHFKGLDHFSRMNSLPQGPGNHIQLIWLYDHYEFPGNT